MDEVSGRDVREACGGRVTVLRQIEGVSTTNMLLATNTTDRDEAGRQLADNR
jgi:bifunctional ADP-heptose synthase (sugar kinase/adenylyltransferase)